jgi:PAS domain S-box-containing protein
MNSDSRVNILLVDDQPGKLLSYEAILQGLGENLLRAGSGREALEHLLKSEIAVILVDVCMPDLDGFQLAAMIREHPRFQKTAIIFISAILLSEMDRLRGYEMGAVDYVPVPVVPEVLRAKVRVFCELYRKTRELEALNAELEQRVAERTTEVEAAAAKLRESERGRSLALAAGNMGSWEWDRIENKYRWDEGQYRIFGVDPDSFLPTTENIRRLVHPDDWIKMQVAIERLIAQGQPLRDEFRVLRPDGETRWCIGVAAGFEKLGSRISGVTIDITDRKSAEERQSLLAREVDHRAKNVLAVVQSIVRLTKAQCQESYVASIEGRIRALASAHNVIAQSQWVGANFRELLEKELAPYHAANIELRGPEIVLHPSAAQTLALALHELATNAAKYGALSSSSGYLSVTWTAIGELQLTWSETQGPPVTSPPTRRGFGSRIITASIEQQLGGQVQFEWKSQGLKCIISMPNQDGTLFVSSAARRSQFDKGLEGPEPLEIHGNRILIVEDESLVALALSEMLEECGFEVVGPCASMFEAIEVIRSRDFDAAVLDVNLNGEMIYPAAEMLADRGIPFVFMTGYGPEGIDRRFGSVVAMHKPIEREKLLGLFRVMSDKEVVRNAS